MKVSVTPGGTTSKYASWLFLLLQSCAHISMKVSEYLHSFCNFHMYASIQIGRHTDTHIHRHICNTWAPPSTDWSTHLRHIGAQKPRYRVTPFWCTHLFLSLSYTQQGRNTLTSPMWCLKKLNLSVLQALRTVGQFWPLLTNGRRKLSLRFKEQVLKWSVLCRPA